MSSDHGPIESVDDHASDPASARGMSAYFSSEAGGAPTQPGRFLDLESVAPFTLAPGIQGRAAVGERCMVNLVQFERDGEAPVHTHAEEQVVVVIEGEVRFDLDGEVRILRAGQAVIVPPWVPHGAI